MRRRGKPNNDGVAWVVAAPPPKRFSTSKQSPIRQRHQQLKVPMPSDVRELIERKHTTITAVRGDPRRIGRVLGGKYTITDRIGSGGFGVVYRALQAPVNRVVAIKLLRGGDGTRVQLLRTPAKSSFVWRLRIVPVRRRLRGGAERPLA